KGREGAGRHVSHRGCKGGVVGAWRQGGHPGGGRPRDVRARRTGRVVSPREARAGRGGGVGTPRERADERAALSGAGRGPTGSGSADLLHGVTLEQQLNELAAHRSEEHTSEVQSLT